MSKDPQVAVSLLQDLERWATECPDQPWLVEQWSKNPREVSWAEGAAVVRSAAAWLAQELPARGSRVGLMAANCADWMLADYAIMASGNVTVPIFTTMNAETVAYAAEFAGIELLILGNATNWDAVRADLPSTLTIVTLPGAPAVEGAIPWASIVAAGAALPAAPAPNHRDLATIVFTSGTTGQPKGVMHSLASLRQAALGMGQVAATQPGCRFISYLPLAHLAERIVVQNHAMVFGGTIFFNENLDSFLADLRNARPTFMLGVPRIWEKLQQVVLTHLVSLEDLAAAKSAGDLQSVGAKVREFLGLGHIEYILTSTAPTPPALKAWYDDLGIVLYDGYGQSEILPVCGNRVGNRKLDSIGIAAHGVEIKIAEDGEILARGGGTAMGYYLAPEKTAETFERDGWVHTGDRGRVDDDGHVYISGRVKEIFKTSRGKYVAPAPVEGRFLETPWVEQACLTGAGHTQTVMIAVLSERAQEQTGEVIKAQLIQWVETLNGSLEKHERIGALILSREPWTQENGILTHTLKTRRDGVEERYREKIEEAGERMRGGEQGVLVFESEAL